MFYRVKKIRGKYYLYREWYDSEKRKRRSLSLGNCEFLEKLVMERKLVPPRGFEPRTSRSSASPETHAKGSRVSTGALPD